MRKNHRKRLICLLLAAVVSMVQMWPASVSVADSVGPAAGSEFSVVLTLGADLSEEQKTQILQYFGVGTDEVKVLTITNQDERDKLGKLIPEEKIGTHTYSCALVSPTNAGGVQVKTANMNYVTSNMIASQLSTSGVYNCEVLTAAPFEVSGTGALTGVMMAYETASGVQLDEEKKELANEELITTGDIADTVGQDQATLIVNDIKIHIVRDQVSEEQEVYDVVDNVVAVTETAAAEAAASQGREAPAKLGEAEHTKLYNFSYKFSQMEYDYAQMQPTLERVTYNIATSTGIDDPITDTFTTTTEETVLSSDSVLLGTNDEIWGDDAIINATNSAAVSERPADPINVYTGEVTLTSAGGVKADEFISGTNIIAYKDVNGSYALMDLNGKLLTESIYGENIRGNKGYIEAVLNDGSRKEGILASDGSVIVDFKYDVAEVAGNMWALGVILTGGGTADNYDYTDYENYYLIDYVDFYYIGTQGTQCVGTLTRDECRDIECKADYINVQAGSGAVTTYDSSFTPVQTADSLYQFGDYDPDDPLERTLGEKTGYYVGSFYGKYAQISENNGYGIMDRYGNIIVPMQFASFETGAGSESYEAGGYFTSLGDEQLQFVTAGGTVTGNFNYGIATTNSILCCGMTARVTKDDGGFILLSADGVESDLGTAYSRLTVIKESEGLLWIGETDSGSGEDLIDWHGNVLLSGSDGYSMSANGSYLISRDGYTSSTLYMVNDAEPVDIANSAGGAQELTIETGEIASLDVYTGDPKVEKAADLSSERFVTGSDLLTATNDGTKYALMDVTDRQLTKPQFDDSIQCEEGWLIVYDIDAQKGGVLSQKAQVVVPCEFDNIKVLNENWIIAYILKPATEDDYDFEDWSNNTYYQIDTAKIYHVNDEEAVSVEVSRDQLADAEAEGDYLNIMDRTTGVVTTYDSSFTAVATVDYIGDFGDFSYETVLYRQLEDKTGHNIITICDDGYAEVYDYDSDTSEQTYGVVSIDGEEILPCEYDDINRAATWNSRYLNVKGYFCVEKDGMVGFVTKGGEVSCELKYESDRFSCSGMSGIYENDDGSFTIVAADGVESGPYANRPGTTGTAALGLFYKIYTDDGRNAIVDWHGNEVVSDCYTCSFAESGKYFAVRKDYDVPAELYTVDGAEVVGVAGTPADQTGTGSEEPEAGTEPGAAESETAPSVTGAAESETTPSAAGTAESETAPSVTGADENGTASGAAGEEAASQDGNTGETQTEGSVGLSEPPENSAENIYNLLQSASQLAFIETNKGMVSAILKMVVEKAAQDYPDVVSVVQSALTLLDSDDPDMDSARTLIDAAIALLPQ